MIDIVEHVTKTLSSIGVPVVFQAYPTGAALPSQYITFFEISDTPDMEAGDLELTAERFVQLNIWSRGNYHNLVKSVRSTMESAGYQRTFAADGPYSDGDSHFNKILRFVFYDEHEN